MATATVPQSTAGQTSTERFDIAYGLQTVNGKKEAVCISPEQAEKLSEKNEFEGSIITVSVDYPSTLEGLIALATTPSKDDEGNLRDQKEVHAEIVKLFVNGAKGKVMNRLRALVTKTDDKGNLTFKEPGTGEVLDLTSEITSGSKRVFLTEEQKMWKGLVFLPQTQKENVWRAYLTGINKEFYIPAE